MTNDNENQFEDCNVIYAECCFTMANRFHKLGDKYKKMGQLELANKLEKEATVQMNAWRKARAVLREAS